MGTVFITHPLYLEHDTGPRHPERPQRLTAILERLEKSPVRERIEFVKPEKRADVDRWIAAVHGKDHVDFVRESIPAEGLSHLDPDTPVSAGSLAAAETAVAGLLTAIDLVLTGKNPNGFCAVRPPGHHAESNRAMGFCLFNNVAVGARYAQKKYALERVFVIDWDVHHGNGTQQIFYDDPTVFYFSTHQYPFYPGSGAASERGAGDGEGFTLNCPLPAGAGDREILKKFENEMAPALERFKPQLLLISAGFDAHRDDPLGGLEVTTDGFAEMTKIVGTLAADVCQGKVVSCLEGGYNLAALAASVEVHLKNLGQR